MNIAVVGTGILGRLLAWRAVKGGHKVTIINHRENKQTENASMAAGGMLAPFAELDEGALEVCLAGLKSLDIMESWIPELSTPIFHERKGSLFVAAKGDEGDLTRIYNRISVKKELLPAPYQNMMSMIDAKVLEDIEPRLSERFTKALFLPYDGIIDSQAFMEIMLKDAIDGGARYFDNCVIKKISTRSLAFNQAEENFDVVCDCRGYGARDDLASLRSVRGELIMVKTKEVKLNRAVRLLHPRCPIYVVPRPDNIFYVGATMIESDNNSNVAVRSTLELLSSLYYLDPAFGEAEICDLKVGLRPAFADHKPRITYNKDRGVMRLNGLFRHGFLLSPILVNMALNILEDQDPHGIEFSEDFYHQENGI